MAKHTLSGAEMIEPTEHPTPAVQRTGNVVEAPQAGPMSSALIQAIADAARDPSVDIEKMERLWSMYERMEVRGAELAFNDAMSRAQAAMTRISADAVNPQTRSAYATYAQLDRALRPIYTEHGFALSFDTGEGAPEGHLRVLCYVSRGAYTRTYRCDMPADGKGAKGGDVMTKTHASGSAMSYGQRYMLKLIFNVAVGEADDDGNGAGGESLRQTWVVKASKAQSAKELQEIRRDGTAAFQKAKDRDGYAEFAAAVKGRAGQLEHAA
jgi:hypothetical protein